MHFASLSVSCDFSARLESSPLLIVGQNGYFRLHLDVIHGRIVVTGQVVSVIVVVNRFVVLWFAAELLHVRVKLEHFAFVRNRLDVVFILVRRFEECALS